MEIKIVKDKIEQKEVERLAQEGYGAVVKAVVDIRREIMAIGGEWHSEAQEKLIQEEDSSALDIWGINIYPWKDAEQKIEYNSLINIKPALNNKDTDIRDSAVREKIQKIIHHLILWDI